MMPAGVFLLNAVVSGISAGLIIWGRLLIRAEHKMAHTLCMCAAMVASALAVAVYLSCGGSSKFALVSVGNSADHEALAFLSVSYRVLVVVAVPLVIVATFSAFGAYWEAHRRMAKLATPVWLCASLVGMMVNFVLYEGNTIQKAHSIYFGLRR